MTRYDGCCYLPISTHLSKVISLTFMLAGARLLDLHVYMYLSMHVFVFEVQRLGSKYYVSWHRRFHKIR